MNDEEARKKIVEVLTRKLCNGMLKDYYEHRERYDMEKEFCKCGGYFKFVKANLPYNDCYLQCNLCDGTKCLLKEKFND